MPAHERTVAYMHRSVRACACKDVRSHAKGAKLAHIRSRARHLFTHAHTHKHARMNKRTDARMNTGRHTFMDAQTRTDTHAHMYTVKPRIPSLTPAAIFAVFEPIRFDRACNSSDQ